MEEQIVLILSQLLERKINVGEEVSANTEANWDSMKHIEIIMTLEEEFGISFAPEDIPQLKSLSKIIEKVKELKC
jgi:putative acyl carrier protein